MDEWIKETVSSSKRSEDSKLGVVLTALKKRSKPK
jgi:hypothetical protein